MKTRISCGALALGIVSGGASAGPLADLLNTITGGGGLTNLILNGADPIPGFNDSPFADFTGQLDGSNALIDAALFEPTGRGNGEIIGAGVGNEGNTGNATLLGLAVLSGDDSGNGALGVAALSDGGNSGQGDLLGVELLNGDTLIGLNSGAAGQGGEVPNPSGLSATELSNTVRPAAQGALQRGGDVSGPLEDSVLVGLDNALLTQVGDAIAPITDPLSPVLDNGLGSSDGGSGSIVSAVLTGDSSTSGNDVSAGIISDSSDSGNGDVVGVGAFGGDNSGGNGIASVAAISGADSSGNGDINAGVANSGAGKGGIVNAGVANGNQTTPPPGCVGSACVKPPVNPVPSSPVTNTTNNCNAENSEQVEGLKGPNDLSQFKRNQDTCEQSNSKQVAQTEE